MATKHYTCREYADLKRRIKIQERELAQCGGTAAGYIAHYSDVSAATAAGFFRSNLENLIHLKQELLACDMRREAKRKEQAMSACAPLTQEMIDRRRGTVDRQVSQSGGDGCRQVRRTVGRVKVS
jgi:hypothetical protein